MKASGLFFCALFFLPGNSSVLSQSASKPPEPQQDTVVKISTELVQLDAVVTDKAGKYVTNLTKKDFKVLEEGDQQEISHFQYVDLSTRYREVVAGGPGREFTKPLTAGEVRRVFAFVIDDLNISAIGLVRVRQMLTDFVDNRMAEGDLAAIVRTGRGNGLYDQFTGDKTMLRRIIGQLLLPSRFSNPEEASGVAGTDTGEGGGEDIPDVSQVTTDTDTEVLHRNLSALGAINYVIKGLQDLPGRKSLVLVSPGYIGRANPDDLNRLLTSTIDTALRAGVVIYAIDIRGLQYIGAQPAEIGQSGPATSSGETQASPSVTLPAGYVSNVSARYATRFAAQRGGGGGGRGGGGGTAPRGTPGGISRPNAGDFDRAFRIDPRLAELSQTSSLRYLADSTGGFAVVNNNDFKTGVERIINDTKGYYVLAYSPKNRNFDGKFRKIEVKVPGGLVVHTRGGYYASPDKATQTEKPEQEELLKLMRSPVSKQEIPVNAAVYKTYVPQKNANVMVQIHIDAGRLKFAPNGDHFDDQLQMAGFIFNSAGRIATSFGDGFNLHLTESEKALALRDGFSSVTQGTIAPGAYQLRALVREPSTGAVGTVSQYFEVPRIDDKRFALSSLFVSKVPVQSAADPSAIKRRLSKGDLLRYQLIVYNPTLDRNSHLPSINSQLFIYRDHKLVYQGQVDTVKLSQGAAVSQLAIAGGLNLSAFEPATYLVQVKITDLLGKRGSNVLAASREMELVK